MCLQGGLLEQQPQAQQLPPSQQSLDQQAAQILSSLGSTDLASLLNRRDRGMPLQGGPDITGLGNQQILPEQQYQQQQQATPEQWQYLNQEQQRDAAGAPQPSFPQVSFMFKTFCDMYCPYDGEVEANGICIFLWWKHPGHMAHLHKLLEAPINTQLGLLVIKTSASPEHSAATIISAL